MKKVKIITNLKTKMHMKGLSRTFALSLLAVLMWAFVPLAAMAQQQKVGGTVTDQNGEAVIGATVKVKDGAATAATVTDIDGRFTLNAPSDGVLTVTYIGYAAQDVPVNGRTVIDIVLKEDNEMLEELVVVGYGTMKKSDLTGSVGSLGSKDINNNSVNNIGSAIQGKISGVQIVDAGKPGDNVNIKIRGLGSINNCDPLVVIDGVPTDLGLNAINMADVDRLDVLKDASATAIYGSRGANGVVMITTKRGSEGKSTLSVSANVSIQNAANVPDLLNASQYAALSNEMMINSGVLTDTYVMMATELEQMVNYFGLSTAIYTQTTDVEHEINGLVTYDRRVEKMSLDKVREINTSVIEATRRK